MTVCFSVVNFSGVQCLLLKKCNNLLFFFFVLLGLGVVLLKSLKTFPVVHPEQGSCRRSHLCIEASLCCVVPSAHSLYSAYHPRFVDGEATAEKCEGAFLRLQQGSEPGLPGSEVHRLCLPSSGSRQAPYNLHCKTSNL